MNYMKNEKNKKPSKERKRQNELHIGKGSASYNISVLLTIFIMWTLF